MTIHFRNYLVGLTVLLSALISLFIFNANASAAVDNTPDCDNVAIIKCGTFSEETLRQKASQDDVPKIFNHLGVSQNDLKGEFVEGIVWRDGRVTVEGKTVATGAMTAGRNFGGNPIEGTNAGVYSTNRFATEGQTAYVRMVDGKFDFAVIKACGNPVKATPKQPEQPPAEEPKPAYECVSLTAEKISRTKVKFTAKATATGGAEIEQYEYGFGDGMGITVPDSTYTYEYKKTGTFETSVVLHVKVNGQTKEVTGPNCKTNVTINPVKKQEEPCVYDDSLPKDSPDCKKPQEYCVVEGKENLPKDSPDCKEVVLSSTTTREKPRRIADTGPETILAGMVGSGALGYGTYAYASSRRHLLSAIFRK